MKKRDTENNKQGTPEMIFRFVSKEFCIVSQIRTPNIISNSQVTITLALKELATNVKLLEILNLGRLYAESRQDGATTSPYVELGGLPSTEDECVEFMRFYIDSFSRKQPTMTPREIITIMVTDGAMKKAISDLYAAGNLSIIKS